MRKIAFTASVNMQYVVVKTLGHLLYASNGHLVHMWQLNHTSLHKMSLLTKYKHASL